MDNLLINRGISVKPGASGNPAEGRTFIVSGVGRGGTTMVAEVLLEAGLHLGDHLAEFISEDLDMMDILVSGDRYRLDCLIADRDALHRDWGFKAPNITGLLRYDDIKRFRSPHLILIFRDPQAIAIRSELSEHREPIQGLRDAAAGLLALIEFAERANCPTLLLSYEKALVFPGEFIAALLRFCTLPVTPDVAGRLRARMQPNAPGYVNGARRSFHGCVDNIVDGVLHGWCCQAEELAPVELDLFVDGRRDRSFRADLFRRDVLAAGWGNGLHGFAIPLDRIDPNARLDVRVAGRIFTLANSGHRVLEYAG